MRQLWAPIPRPLVHAFELLTGTALVAAYALAGNPDPESPAAKATTGTWWLAIAAYLFFSLRRVYGGRRWRILLKILPLGFLYILLVTLVVGGVALLSIVTL